MDIYDVAGLNESWARYWLAMDGWTIDEAANLLCGVSPSEHHLTQWSQVKSFDMGPQFQYEATFRTRRDLLQRSAEAQVLTFPARPGAVIEWAMSKGMQLPALLIPADMAVKGARWVKLGAEPAPAQSSATSAPVEAVGALGGVDPTPDPERRLALLRALGGGAKYARGEWKLTGIAALVAEERANGCKRCDEKTIRADLKEAAQAEREAKRAGLFDGLGKR